MDGHNNCGLCAFCGAMFLYTLLEGDNEEQKICEFCCELIDTHEYYCDLLANLRARIKQNKKNLKRLS